MEERIPQTIREVDTIYCCVSVDRFAFTPRIIGGVMIPANMERACWKPSNAAKSRGISSFSPKNGAALLDFFMNGRFGLKRKA